MVTVVCILFVEIVVLSDSVQCFEENILVGSVFRNVE